MIRGDQLMIGDFVLVDGKPRKVEAITKNKIGYHRKENEPRLYYARLRDVEPIELNEYIFRTSGFCRQKYSTLLPLLRSAFYFEGDRFTIELRDEHSFLVIWANNEANTRTIREVRLDEVKYVHELQHAIRLCGVNFEVKL